MAQYIDVPQPSAFFRTGIIAPAERTVRRTADFARHYPLGFAGAAILVIVAFLAIAAPLVTVQNPNEVNLSERKEEPSWHHILGTDYVLATRATGVSNLRMMALHIAPQCIAPYLVLASAHLGVAIIIESSLGFLGVGIPRVGIPPPTSTWGNMLGGAVANILIPHWPLVVFPGVAISLVVLGFNFFGDAVRDAFDPKLRGR